MKTLPPKLGMEPQIEVAMNRTPANKMDERRPTRSPSHPHRNEPRTVPVMAAKGR